jgi:hypothetical protein
VVIFCLRKFLDDRHVMESHRMEIFVTMISASTGHEELEVSFFRKFLIQNNGNVRLSIVL